MTKRINSWHPFAEKFPPLTGEEWEAFKADVKKAGGNKVPVIYRRVKGKVQGIDGRNRYRACEELGLPCRLEEIVLKDDEVKDHIIRLNVRRRHLTPEMRQAIVNELRADGESTRQIAEVLGVSHQTIHRDLKESVVTNVTTDDGQKAEKEASTPKNGVVTGRDGKTYAATKPEPAESIFCDRCRRVGPAKNCQGCADLRAGKKSTNGKPAAKLEREPGDDTETIEAEKKAEKARPKNGQPLFNWPAFKADFGRVVQQLGKLYVAYGRTKPDGSVKEDAAYRELDGLLGQYLEGFKKVYRNVTKEKAPVD